MAAQIMRVLTPENIESIREYLLAGGNAGHLHSAWDEGKARLDDAIRDFDAVEAVNPGSDELDRLCDAVTDAQDKLFDAAAPHMKSVLWKLDHLQECSEGAVVTASQIKKVSDDIRRLFGEA